MGRHRIALPSVASGLVWWFGMTDTVDQLNTRQYGFNLFLVGFLVLFLELACIRWFSAYVIFLQFFTNVALIACFLGMSCGCLAARRSGTGLRGFRSSRSQP